MKFLITLICNILDSSFYYWILAGWGFIFFLVLYYYAKTL